MTPAAQGARVWNRNVPQRPVISSSPGRVQHETHNGQSERGFLRMVGPVPGSFRISQGSIPGRFLNPAGLLTYLRKNSILDTSHGAVRLTGRWKV
jgi:hypothetical protein